MNNQNVEPATSKSDIVLVTLAVLCAVAGVIAFSLLTSQTLAVRLGALFGGLVAGVVLAWFSPSGKRLLNYGRQSWEELRRVVWPTRKETLNTTGLVSRKDVAGMYAIAGDGTLQSFVGASAEGVFIKAGSIKLEGLVTANGNFRILEDGSIEAANGVFKGEIEATSGTIGGFEIGRNRIGAVASQTGSGGSLAIYENFFRVGGDSGYAMLGNDVIPASAGGAFSAVGRIVNQKQNSDAQWGFDSANYGLFIDVSGGTKNYGICSNAALIAPSFVGTKASILTFDSGSYKVDFSHCNVILMYYNDPNYSGTNVELPGELSVARQFGLSVLPDDFAATVTFRVRPGSKKIILQGIYNHNEALVDYGMEAGDSVTVLITKIDGFRYQILNHSS